MGGIFATSSSFYTPVKAPQQPAQPAYTVWASTSVSAAYAQASRVMTSSAPFEPSYQCSLCGHQHHPSEICPLPEKPPFTLQELEEAQQMITELSNK